VVLFLLVLGVSVAVFAASFVPLDRSERRRMLLAGALVVLLLGGVG
jgi:hypothetical protein